MSRISEGRLYLNLRNGQISKKKFIERYNSLKKEELTIFKEVDKNQLGKFIEHEAKHAEFYQTRGMSCKFYISLDGKMACTIPDDQEYLKYVDGLTDKEFIDFLIEAHNPGKLDASSLNGTDYLIYQILTGKFGENEIVAWVSAEALK